MLSPKGFSFFNGSGIPFQRIRFVFLGIGYIPGLGLPDRLCTKSHECQCGQGNDGRFLSFGELPQPAKHFQAVHPWWNINQDQIRLNLGNQCQGCQAVCCPGHFETPGLQNIPQDVGSAIVIFGQEDARGSGWRRAGL